MPSGGDQSAASAPPNRAISLAPTGRSLTVADPAASHRDDAVGHRGNRRVVRDITTHTGSCFG